MGESGIPDEQGFLAYLRRAGDLIAARRLPEAEVEILSALSSFPSDLRAVKLLALVRFKLGRLAEARELYESALRTAPEDAAIRLNLGLIALKLDSFDEAVAELEHATRLHPEDTRAWSYLGYAYARVGASGRAAAAFRRAGQPEVAMEIERADSAGAGELEGSSGTVSAGLAADDPAAVGMLDRQFGRLEMPGFSSRSIPPESATGGSARDTAPLGADVSVTAFAFSRLVDADLNAASVPEVSRGVLRLAVDGEAHVRGSALMASAADLQAEEAFQRRQGRLTDIPLGRAEHRFLRYLGAGELWVAPITAAHELCTLRLDRDILYVREDMVVAFDGEVVWECGHVPRDGLPILQFRGSGRLVVEITPRDVLAFRIEEGRALTVPRERLIGWVGRVVSHRLRRSASSPLSQIACEGEGVLLVTGHAKSAQPVHERPQPGDDGSGVADSGRSLLHR